MRRRFRLIPHALGDRYAKLKLAGIKEAPAQLTVFADRGTGVGHGLGRRTIPEMIKYSVVTAVHTMWLTSSGLKGLTGTSTPLSTISALALAFCGLPN